MFNHISKHLKVRQKYSAVPRISTLFSVFGNVMKHALTLERDTVSQSQLSCQETDERDVDYCSPVQVTSLMG